jgi:asparagine synthase (glutamine-hydrolysing)
MCGLAGFLDPAHRDGDETLARLGNAMGETLHHRGPDDSGTWSDAEAGVVFAHRRLAIIDISPTGHQPMMSANGRHVLIYNGEIYNAGELRRELEDRGIRFCGHSDTEVILEGIAAWGLDALVARLLGMFAIAVWDRLARKLSLVRDRMGIKPLYWGRVDGRIAFASELKALRRLPNFSGEIDRDALVGLLRNNFIPSPVTIYKDIEKLSPGSIATIDETGSVTVRRYWDVLAIAEACVPDMSEVEAIEEFESLLLDSVARRMIADVPLGAFLSGGVDSSLVAALMQSQSTTPIKTFTVGFHNARFNEAQHAKGVALHLGTDHTEEYLDAAVCRDLIPSLPTWYDEPFADMSQLPTYLVSRMTREHVKVALSGDGGDEVFAGYTRYLWARSFSQTAALTPGALRRMVSLGVRSLTPERWSALSSILPTGVRPAQFGDRLYKIANILKYDDDDQIYRALVSQWQDPTSGVIGGQDPGGALFDNSLRERIPDPVARMQALDMVTYLPDDILTKVDRASMAVGLEARVPLIDHRIVELSWRLPASLKIRKGQGKWLLRQILEKYVPKPLIDRPKQGFGAPVGSWLRGPLRDWAEDLLSQQRLREEGYLRPEPIRDYWSEHLDGQMNRQYQLWGPLMFQAWLAHTRSTGV